MGEDMVVEVLGGRDRKIERRRGLWPAKPKSEAHGLGFILERANNQGGCGGGLSGGSDMVVEVVGACDSAQTGPC